MADDDVLSPDPILELGTAYFASRALMSAVELDLFTALAEGPAGLEEIRERLGLHRRAAGDFLEALTALGMLERTGDDRYRNSALAARYLDRGRPSYVGGFAELSGTALFPAWTRLTEGLRSGEPQVEQPKDGDFFARTYQDPGRVRRFLSSMDAVNGRLAEELARCVDWSRYG
ncbi:methyltransferase family protein, partial [Wenjunlia tyrosinilytica]|uniref:methyltransferase family protein n=1 Tax=Wenjunlia tyrosinilytica TaxID=1544741 RepID=UPI0027E4FB5A